LDDGVISEANVKTFKVINTPKDKNSRYAKDKNNVYYFGKKISSANTKSFVVLSTQYAKDINYCYSYGKITSKSECR
jgi:hypothetical protein